MITQIGDIITYNKKGYVIVDKTPDGDLLLGNRYTNNIENEVNENELSLEQFDISRV